MKTQKLIFATLLISLGLVLNLMTPPFIGLMKPDFLLAMYLIALTQLSNFKELSVIMIVCAVLYSVTTSMPGAELANFIEKCIAGIVVYSLILKIPVHHRFLKSLLIGGGGTLLSGCIFLLIMMVTGFISNGIVALIVGVVIPTSIVNTLVFGIFDRTLKNVRTSR